jgi:hypothetical protein
VRVEHIRLDETWAFAATATTAPEASQTGLHRHLPPLSFLHLRGSRRSGVDQSIDVRGRTRRWSWSWWWCVVAHCTSTGMVSIRVIGQCRMSNVRGVDGSEAFTSLEAKTVRNGIGWRGERDVLCVTETHLLVSPSLFSFSSSSPTVSSP